MNNEGSAVNNRQQILHCFVPRYDALLRDQRYRRRVAVGVRDVGVAAVLLTAHRHANVPAREWRNPSAAGACGAVLEGLDGRDGEGAGAIPLLQGERAVRRVRAVGKGAAS